MEDKIEDYQYRVNSIHKRDIIEDEKNKKESINEEVKIHKRYFFNNFQWDIITSIIGLIIIIGMTFLIVKLVGKIFD
jgi:uncharacterized membrane protein